MDLLHQKLNHYLIFYYNFILKALNLRDHKFPCLNYI